MIPCSPNTQGARKPRTVSVKHIVIARLHLAGLGWPESPLRGDFGELAPNTAATGMKTLLPGCYGESRHLCLSCPQRKCDGSVLRCKTSTAIGRKYIKRKYIYKEYVYKILSIFIYIYKIYIKNFPNSFYCSGTNFNTEFY